MSNETINMTVEIGLTKARFYRDEYKHLTCSIDLGGETRYLNPDDARGLRDLLDSFVKASLDEGIKP